MKLRNLIVALGVAATASVPAQTSVAQQQQAMTLGTITAAPGRAESGFLKLRPTARDTGTAIPITVIQGRQTGPVVAIVAGVHGAEYPPILALQVLRPLLKAEDVRGTVILVHCANLSSFFARTVYYNPVDWQNLNRVFPGAADSTLSYRVAATLVREVIAKADIVVDAHAGDANEALLSYVGVVLTGDSARDARTRELGEALGFERVIETTLPTPIPTPTRYLSRTAAAMGKLSVAIESGELGRRDSAYVQPIVSGLLNLLRTAGVLPGAAQRYQARERYAGNRTATSPASGVLWPRVRLGQEVRERDTLAVVTDMFGEPLAAILSPANGKVMYQAVTPPISAGETAAAVAVSK